ncbi:MAG: serine hydrolase [Pyrinomonadaceae bacterium]
MIKRTKAILCLFALWALSVPGVAQMQSKNVEISTSKDYTPLKFENSPELQSILNTSIGEVLNSYPARGFKADDISATLIDLRNTNDIRSADFMGDDRVYPASVVKMFYMAALHQQLEDGKVIQTSELNRGLKDMIVDSSNEATQYILDVLTDTASGAEKPQKGFEEWQYKRNRVNRYFSSMGYENINVNQKTFCEDAYGIEQQSRRYKGENRNMLTTNAAARLMAEIVLGRVVTSDRSRQMMELMKREPFAQTKDPDDQAHAFTGIALIDRKMTDAKIWSKAGWTSSTRHDAAYIETPDGLKFVLVIFTENHASEKAPIPTIAGKIIERLSKKKVE